MVSARKGVDKRDALLCELIAATARVYPDGVHRNPSAWPKARRLDAIAMALVGRGDALPEGSEKHAADLLSVMDNYRDGALGAYSEAQKLCERALAIREKVLGMEHVDTAGSLNNLGYLRLMQGDLLEAKAYYERALSVKERIGAEGRSMAMTLDNLGGLLYELGEDSSARGYCERALAIREKSLGPNDPAVAVSLVNLAEFLRREGDYLTARRLLERALAIDEQFYGLGSSRCRHRSE